MTVVHRKNHLPAVKAAKETKRFWRSLTGRIPTPEPAVLLIWERPIFPSPAAPSPTGSGKPTFTFTFKPEETEWGCISHHRTRHRRERNSGGRQSHPLRPMPVQMRTEGDCKFHHQRFGREPKTLESPSVSARPYRRLRRSLAHPGCGGSAPQQFRSILFRLDLQYRDNQQKRGAGRSAG